MATRGNTEDRKHNQYKLNNDTTRQLRSAMKRIEKLEEERQAITDDIKDEYALLKGSGFDVAAVREFMAERKKSRKLGDKFTEREDFKDLVRVAIGLGAL